MVYYWVDMGFPHTLKAYSLRFGQSNSKQCLRKFRRCSAKATALQSVPTARRFIARSQFLVVRYLKNDQPSSNIINAIFIWKVDD